MRLKHEPTLTQYRVAGPCEACGRYCPRREAAHVYAKGGGRIDHRLNLLGLGGPFECGCHHRSHLGHEPKQQQLVNAVAAREGVTPAQLRAFVWAVRREPQPEPGTERDRAAEILQEVIGRATIPHHSARGGFDPLPGPAPRPRILSRRVAD